MEHRCSMCPFFSKSQIMLLKHLNKQHKYSKKYIIHCCSKGCGRSFKSYSTFRKHCWRKHKKELDEEEELGCDENLTDEETDRDSVKTGNKVSQRQLDEATYLLNLKVGCRISQTAVDQIVISTKDLLSERLSAVREAVQGQVPDLSFLEGVLKNDLFEGLETKYLQEKFFNDHLGYVKPRPVKLGSKVITQTKKGQHNFIQKDVYGYVVPFKEQLSALLSQPEVAAELQNPSGKIDSFYCYDVQDGSYYQNHPLVKQHGDETLIFSLYADDFEVVNPIGSHRKKHKLTAFYWTLLNVPAHHRSKLSFIQLAALVKSRDMRKYGSRQLLADFVKAMQDLEKGITLQINNQDVQYHGFLLLVQGDTPAAQYLGGFKEGVGQAHKPCRTCEVTKEDLHKSRTPEDYPLRDEEEHRDRVQHLETLSKPAFLYWSKTYGITGSGCLFDIPAFSLTKCIMQDPMHLLLEGILRYELSCLLTELIEVKHYFTLQVLNQRIEQFDYSREEKRDRPQAIDKSHLKPGSVFAQSAQSMWVLVKNLPFLVGGLIEEGDEHWRCFLLLLQITVLSVSSVASPYTMKTLKYIIVEHHDLFVKLYQMRASHQRCTTLFTCPSNSPNLVVYETTGVCGLRGKMAFSRHIVGTILFQLKRALHFIINNGCVCK